MHDHTEAEHQDDCVHIKGDGVCQVQNIENTVIAEVDDKRIDGIIFCPAQADEDIVDDGTARIRDIKGRKLYDDGKYLLCISEILSITEKRSPCRNCNRPKYNACGGNEYEQKKITVLCKIPPQIFAPMPYIRISESNFRLPYCFYPPKLR